MKLTDDLKAPWLMHLKGALFVVIVVMCATVLFLQVPTLTTGILILAMVWASCRFYYYLFYVLERYLGREKRFAGVVDALCFLATKTDRSSPPALPPTPPR